MSQDCGTPRLGGSEERMSQQKGPEEWPVRWEKRLKTMSRKPSGRKCFEEEEEVVRHVQGWRDKTRPGQ